MTLAAALMPVVASVIAVKNITVTISDTEPDRVEESIIKSLDLFHTAAITYATLIAEFEQILAEYRQGDIGQDEAKYKIRKSTEFVIGDYDEYDDYE